MNNITANNNCAVVIGAGHAGCESALALARLGVQTTLLAINLDSVAFLACNPSIGGTSKGHLVCEVDALGGEMGRCADATLIHLRMLNASKGEAVQSLRAQVDKHAYHSCMKNAIENQPNLQLFQAEATDILLNESGEVCGVVTPYATFPAKAVVVACGVYLNSRIIVGENIKECGPNGFARSQHLSDCLQRLGFTLRRFKTGTPARIDGRTINYAELESQEGEHCRPFSALTNPNHITPTKSTCYLGYTSEETKKLLLNNLHRAPMYSGEIKGIGARYCPSIEDKVVRFKDKERHQFFLEPEGLHTNEVYVAGISTSMPFDVQQKLYQTLDGMQNATIMRPAYAIEYDCIDSTELSSSLESKRIGGLFFAGQINGTSGYEEAAAQGLVAGVNAGLKLQGKEQLYIGRQHGYIGVLIDDLVTKGVTEPYRMMSSRAEYRLMLRQDNADTRLTPMGRQVGLVCDQRWSRFTDKMNQKSRVVSLLGTLYKPKEVAKLFENMGEPLPQVGITLEGIFKRGKGNARLFIETLPQLAEFNVDAVAEVINDVRFEGYIARQHNMLKEVAQLEDVVLPEIDYSQISGLRLEARAALNRVKPRTLGQASRISGVNPADIAVLIVWLKK